MKRYFFCKTIIVLLLFSCSKKQQCDLLEIPIDIDQSCLIPLSEITEKITAIKLELTNESLLSPEYIQNIIISEGEVFIAARMVKIYVFNEEGKFIRTIGSKGQGPGEYLGIMGFALDEKNRRLYINGGSKIISYGFNGNFLKEIKIQSGVVIDINYINEELLLLVDKNISDSNGTHSHSALYKLNNNLQIVDSCTIRDLYIEGGTRGSSRWNTDFILKGNKSTYLYYGDFFRWNNFEGKALRDTLYRFENNRLIPDLKLKFKNDGIGKFIDMNNLYRSSRYIFTVYRNNNKKSLCFFCYDTKTGNGYNHINVTQDGNGFTDDINLIEKQVRIRPSKLDTEMFYYLHTHMKPDDLEEPNPTLYIGRLKK